MTNIQKNIEVTKSGTNCSLKLIRQAANEGFCKQLAFYHLVKYHYKNSCLYRYQSRMPELANTFNISTQTLYRYIAILSQNELVFKHTTNLVLRSIRKVKNQLTDKRQCKIRITENDALFDIECRLYAKIIERHAQKMAYNESLRRLKARDSHDMGTIENEFSPSLSIRNVAKLLNLSKSKAIKVINTLNRLAIIKTTKQPPKMLKRGLTGFKIEFVEDFPGYHFLIADRLFIQFGAKHELNEYPVYLPKLSYKSLIKRTVNQ